MGILGRITSKGQTTVPKAVRDALGLHEGSMVEWEVADGRAYLLSKSVDIAELAGILGNPLGRALTDEEMDDAIGQAVAEDDERIRREWHERRHDGR
ncbi:AbrB/MazE/SpoVT family DNA-binding domain-containing protein [Jiella sonneratiae]|uniref:Type II toxin-antitoxin system PrlF family antitoxin n=1 Tax=Jiella sonneratiae TaxID=2816856 RepID=A0ABS3J6G3_9HYPH|nr:AbrB/MazE/SpoVT family DNA-binding domain-containing protein [Jiella sonneratiae]MBO0905250.1 type II toxin-antitoxin system PrlF family antitoxin [Jiella sonneratiae]